MLYVDCGENEGKSSVHLIKEIGICSDPLITYYFCNCYSGKIIQPIVYLYKLMELHFLDYLQRHPSQVTVYERKQVK